ncbi:amidohydrolase family protein [Terracidiphilus gabretensis]|uniref:amidohydrolase family protein n=1 Tax=Terracidiphilus gabretensis TaxID=1577687 RepID=UPI00071C0B87|nr:amidohydrolase family protein [Terracidiphilus gabretensis]
MVESAQLLGSGAPVVLFGARCCLGPRHSMDASLSILDGRITQLQSASYLKDDVSSARSVIDLDGYMVMPGLVNAHDHLQFALFPRLANPPYRNYVDWGEDIHTEFADILAIHRKIPKDVRLRWGGIRNLLCGATTVCHHDVLWPELQKTDFPIKVVQKYGWAHSLALGGDIVQAYASTPKGAVFIMHACEGIDDQAREELSSLDRLGLLQPDTVLVHGLAIDDRGAALMRERGVSLIVCPSSNEFLFERLPNIFAFDRIENLVLGNDSPLTATGDLLDEVRFAANMCGVALEKVYRMVTEAPAAVLRLKDGEGVIRLSGSADLIAVRDTGRQAADTLPRLSFKDIELVMISGQVQLASETIFERLPPASKKGLEPLWIDGILRWLRAPVKDLLQRTEEVLGKGQVRLGGKGVVLS